MSTPASPSGPPGVDGQRSPRRVAWGSVLAVVLAVVVWVTGTWLLDASSLSRGEGLFGYNFGAAIYSAIVGVPVLGLVAVAAVVASVAGSSLARGAMTAGVVLCALAGAGLGILGLVTLLSGGSAGDAVFVVITVVSAGVLFAPAWFAWDVLADR